MKDIKSTDNRHDEERVHKLLYGILCIIPAVLILFLGIRLVNSVNARLLEPPAASESKVSNKAITIEEVSEDHSPKVFEEERTIELTTIEDGLNNLGFLVTQEYYFTEVLSDKKARKFLKHDIGITEESYTVSYEGYIEAGVDFTRVVVSLDENGKVLNLELPEVEIRGPVIDPDSADVKDEKHSIFTDFTEEERAEAMQDFKRDVLEKAISKGIKDKAREHAEDVIRSFVENLAGKGYKVNIK